MFAKLKPKLLLAAAALMLVIGTLVIKHQYDLRVRTDEQMRPLWPARREVIIQHLAQAGKPVILLMGDSNFELWGIDRIGNYRVVNGGLAGIRAEQYLGYAAGFSPGPKQIDAVAIMIGTNNAAVEKRKPFDPAMQAKFKSAIGQLMDLARGWGARVIVLTIPPIERPNGDQAAIPAYNDIIRAEVSQRELQLIETSSILSQHGATRDGTHLTNESFDKLSAELSAQLSK